MQPEELEQFALTLASIADYLRQQTQQQMDASANTLQQMQGSLQHFDALARALPQQALAAVSQQAHQAVTGAAQQAVAAASGQLNALASSSQDAIRALQVQTAALRATQQSMAWKAGLGLVAGSLLAVLGVGLYGWTTMQQLKRAGFSQQLLQATRSGALVECGAALCARVGRNAKRAGKDGDYVLVAAP